MHKAEEVRKEASYVALDRTREMLLAYADLLEAMEVCSGETVFDGAKVIETPQEFARRIALIAMEEEREECAKVCEEAAEYHRRFADSVSQLLCVSNASAIRRRGKP